MTFAPANPDNVPLTDAAVRQQLAIVYPDALIQDNLWGIYQTYRARGFAVPAAWERMLVTFLQILHEAEPPQEEEI